MRVTGAGQVTTPVSIGNGGTGQTTAAAALAALGGVGAGSHFRKVGSGSGTYITTSTTTAAIDAANLDVTTTIATGMLAISMLQFIWQQASGSTGEVGIALDGTQNFRAWLSGSLSNNLPIAGFCMDIFVGDGASHTISPRFRLSSGAATLTLQNNAAPDGIMHFVFLIPAT